MAKDWVKASSEAMTFIEVFIEHAKDMGACNLCGCHEFHAPDCPLMPYLRATERDKTPMQDVPL